MDRPNKPAALSASAGKPLPQAQVSISQSSSLVTAVLPSGDSVEVLLYGATVTSWKDASGAERLFVSSASKMDGSKPVRGGIPLVFPVFGPPPKDHATGKLPQHGFARNSRWEFLGKAGDGESESGSVKLDFALSSGSLDQAWKDKWGYDFGLVYSVCLAPGSLATSLVVSNEGEEPFECQVLMHTYFRVNVRFSCLAPVLVFPRTNN
jgi:glucose-6-phosphate 1-epimerase